MKPFFKKMVLYYYYTEHVLTKICMAHATIERLYPTILYVGRHSNPKILSNTKSTVGNWQYGKRSPTIKTGWLLYIPTSQADNNS